MEDMGKYYEIIMDLIGGVGYLYSSHVESIYDAIPHYIGEEYIVDKEEFKISLRYALEDAFGDGCEIEVPEDLFDFLDKK